MKTAINVTEPLTADGAELELLHAAQANKDGLLILPVGPMKKVQHQWAIERLVLNDHLRLIDVSMMQAPGPNGRMVPVPARVFRISMEGRGRLAMLRVGAVGP